MRVRSRRLAHAACRILLPRAQYGRAHCTARNDGPRKRRSPQSLTQPPPMANKATHDHTPDSSAPPKLPVSLYVVATPLGNLRDVTLRALEVLAAVDMVAAEDTRTSATLLGAHGIRTQLMAAHDHNEQAAAARIVELLVSGRSVALISDAGTPAVSDPGARIVRAVHDAGFRVTPIPGPSAAIGALSVAGFEGPFEFHGFLPPKSAARRARLRELKALPRTLVLYEAPHRIVELAHDLAAELEPARRIVVARELTKRFENVAPLTVADLKDWLEHDPNRQRGEFVLVIEGARPDAEDNAEALRVLGLLLAELPVKAAARLAAAITGASKNAMYAHALAQKAATADHVQPT